jgi:hypothetical protein
MKCKSIFGHKWRYYFGNVFGNRVEIRACSRCHTVSRWVALPFPNHHAWVNMVQWTDHGAQKKCKGYRKDEVID